MDTEEEKTVTDSDLYNEALETPEVPEAEVKEDRPRDEKGRFATKEETEEETPPVVEEEPPVEPAKEEKPDHRIPLTELLNEREKRQAEQRRAEAALKELEELRQRLNPPAPVPDQFQSPDEYNAYWRDQLAQQQQSVEQRFRNQEANFSLRLAHMQHGEVFEQAYSALIASAEAGDRSAAQAVANSSDPGKTLVDWYKREQALKELGGSDPQSYVEKKLEEALNDPKFIARAIEKAKATAGTQPTQVKLPPSLNKAAPAGKADDTTDSSDAGLYQYATR